MKVSAQQLIPGNWYLLASCEYCHTKHVVETELPDDTRLPKEFYQSECPSCLRLGLYAAGEIERYQHGAGVSSAKTVT